MSLTVIVLRRDGQARERRSSAPAGFERWRTEVWGSAAVRRIAESVRRPRPSRLLLPTLEHADLEVSGEELDQLLRETEQVIANAPSVLSEIHLEIGRPLVRAIVKGIAIGRATAGADLPAATDAEELELFLERLHNIRMAVCLAKQTQGGLVQIS